MHHQKMRTEISQAKREADFFKGNVERSKRLKRKPQKQEQPRVYEFRQKETDETVRSSRGQKQSAAVSAPAAPPLDEEGPSASKRGRSDQNSKKAGKKSSKNRMSKDEDRTAFLQSVFGGE